MEEKLVPGGHNRQTVWETRTPACDTINRVRENGNCTSWLDVTVVCNAITNSFESTLDGESCRCYKKLLLPARLNAQIGLNLDDMYNSWPHGDLAVTSQSPNSFFVRHKVFQCYWPEHSAWCQTSFRNRCRFYGSLLAIEGITTKMNGYGMITRTIAHIEWGGCYGTIDHLVLENKAILENCKLRTKLSTAWMDYIYIKK